MTAVLLLVAPLALTLGLGLVVVLAGGPDLRHASRVALAAVGAQAFLMGLAWVLLAFVPEYEQDHGDGTCALYRRSDLDEAVVALGLVSGIVGALALGGSVAAMRQTRHARWVGIIFASVVLPYVIYVSWAFVGLCSALDT